MTKKMIIAALSVGIVTTEIAWQVWKYVKKYRVNSKKNETKNKEFIAADGNEVIMFTEDGKLCRDHASTRIACGKNCPVGKVKRVVSCLKNARETLDVCIYMITYDDLTDAIVRAHRQGVRVRMIVDSGMGEYLACNKQILRMRRAGIEIRMNKLEPSSLMHHKFAIVDEKIVLFGSSNWTTQAFYGNNDSIVITDHRKYLEAFSAAFAKMWQNFDLGPSGCDLQVQN